MLKEVDILKPISEQKGYNNNYGRYWIKPVLKINDNHYILCSQWFSSLQDNFDSWLNRQTECETLVSNISSGVNKNIPDDYRFSKGVYVRESDPAMARLSERIGTPSHIEYLKMSDGDSRRHKSRCIEYDNKKSVCMCVLSPYFTMHCGGSSHCKYYKENVKPEKVYLTKLSSKEKIYVVPIDTQKKRKCTSCHCRTERQMLDVSYFNGKEQVENKLGVYVCAGCGKKYLVETLFKTYTSSKKMSDISVEFVR